MRELSILDKLFWVHLISESTQQVRQIISLFLLKIIVKITYIHRQNTKNLAFKSRKINRFSSQIKILKFHCKFPRKFPKIQDLRRTRISQRYLSERVWWPESDRVCRLSCRNRTMLKKYHRWRNEWKVTMNLHQDALKCKKFYISLI